MKILSVLMAGLVIAWLSLPIVTLAAGSGTESKPGAGSHVAQFIRGELVKIEGQFYVVKESSGKEVRLMVDDHTKLIGTLQPGAKIEAQVMEDGYATSIKEVRG
jgi:hypothetical protein